MKKVLFTICLSVLAIAGFAKDGFHVKGTIRNNTDSLVFF